MPNGNDFPWTRWQRDVALIQTILLLNLSCAIPVYVQDEEAAQSALSPARGASKQKVSPVHGARESGAPSAAMDGRGRRFAKSRGVLS